MIFYVFKIGYEEFCDILHVRCFEENLLDKLINTSVKYVMKKNNQF